MSVWVIHQIVGLVISVAAPAHASTANAILSYDFLLIEVVLRVISTAVATHANKNGQTHSPLRPTNDATMIHATDSLSGDETIFS